MARLLLVCPGSDIATGDLYAGLVPALRRRGHEVIEYALSARIDRQANWLKYNYRRAKKLEPTIVKPTWADILYLAGERVIPLALREMPDLVLVVSGMFFHPDLLVLLKRAGLRVGLLNSESPYDDQKFYRLLPIVDIAWTNERHSVQVLRYANANTHYLPLAYDPERHRPAQEGSGHGPADAGERSTAPLGTGQGRNVGSPSLEAAAQAGRAHPDQEAPTHAEYSDVPAHDVVFVGTGFQERINLLSAIDWTGIDFGLYGGWSMLPSRHPLRQYVRARQVPNELAVSLYRKAKIGLNLYRTSVGYGRNVPSITTAESLSPRALELAACGVFTLSDDRAEVGEVFGEAVPTFKTPQELEAAIRYWLDPEQDAMRRELAARLPGLVAGRTFDAMAARIERDLAPLLSGAPHGYTPALNGAAPQPEHARQEVVTAP